MTALPSSVGDFTYRFKSSILFQRGELASLAGAKALAAEQAIV